MRPLVRGVPSCGLPLGFGAGAEGRETHCKRPRNGARKAMFCGMKHGLSQRIGNQADTLFVRGGCLSGETVRRMGVPRARLLAGPAVADGCFCRNIGRFSSNPSTPCYVLN